MENSYNLNFRLLQVCSGHYLSAVLPENWKQLTDSEQIEFLQENAWQPFENYCPEFVWQCIESAAIATQEYVDSLLVETEREEQTTSNFKIDVPCSCGHCESDQYYQCKGCSRVCAYCFGGSDVYQDYCDDCYHELDNNLVTALVG